MMFKIDSSIPVPPRKDAKYPFASMVVGQSFFVPESEATKSSISTCAIRAKPMRFTYRTVTENGVVGTRCWRTE